MLNILIRKLEQVEQKLTALKNEDIIKETSLPHAFTRIISNTVNILNSLVDKTIRNNNYDDDISFCHNSNSSSSVECMFSNFKDTINLNVIENVQIKNSSQLSLYLLNFLDVLGDLVFSLWEISCCQANLASGMKVGELVTIKNYYLALWKIVSRFYKPNFYLLDQIDKAEAEKPADFSDESLCLIDEFVNVAESCLNDISKVKLYIEHYIKGNMEVLQFTGEKHENDFNGNHTNVVEENYTENRSREHLKPQDDNENKWDNQAFLREYMQEGNEQSALRNMNATDAELRHPGPCTLEDEFYLNPCNHPQDIEEWDYCINTNYAQEPRVSIFNTPYIYPPEILFLDPRTAFLKPQVQLLVKNSLPKIYSVESVNNNHSNPYRGHFLDSENKNCKNYKISNNLFECTEEDLFSENLETKIDDEEYINIRKKISALLNNMKNEKSYNDGIFEEETKKITNKDYFQKKEKVHHTKAEKDTAVNAKNIYRTAKKKLTSDKKHKLKIQTNTGNKEENLSRQKYLKREKNKFLSNHPVLPMQNPMQFSLEDCDEVIYDENSLIELFKTKRRESINDDSEEMCQKNFNLWPVVGNYIYVSKENEAVNCHSDTKSTSILLGKRYEESFYTLQMNKRYEGNQLYEGDLINLNHTNNLKNERVSNFSLSEQLFYKEQKSLKNEDMSKYFSLNCTGMTHFTNQRISINNLFVPKDHSISAQQQTFAVHYSDCGDSLMCTRNLNFKKLLSKKNSKVNFFDFKNYNCSQNWDSFLSIITKFGTDTHFNERRMIRKFANNLGPQTLNQNNFVGEVQTLMSNGVPYRLFDVNGYPVTDSEGNVLKDPYGKNLVELDATGFPKNDTRVFDAAGYSPRDIKFDPTKKPHTNCIIVKLTDNFMRPLHLFDKYGRPLTDHSGNLLVNIHGRPLLRFDNFGRPNTDYRGGPLYTDNGFRWSFKEQSRSKEHVCNEALAPEKLNSSLFYPRMDKSHCNNTANDKEDIFDVSYGQYTTKKNDLEKVNSGNSEVWLQVENVLQNYSKKGKNTKISSETKLVVNHVAIKPHKEVKDYLKQIIYHHDSEGNNYLSNGSESKKRSGEEKFSYENESKNYRHNTFSEGTHNHDASKEFSHEMSKLPLSHEMSKVPLSFFDQMTAKSVISKYLKNKMLSQELNYLMSNIICDKKNNRHDQGHLTNENVFKINKKENCSPMNYKNNSKCALKNKEYINNLCNEILKSKMESKIASKSFSSKTPQAISTNNGKTNHFTDISLPDYTSSFVSKYTSDIPLYTDSPANSIAYQTKDPQILKILNDTNRYDRPTVQEKNVIRENTRERRSNFVDGQNFKLARGTEKKVQTEGNKYKNKKRAGHLQNIVQPSDSSTEINTYIDVLAQNSNQYQINIKERMRTGYQACEDDEFTLAKNNFVADDDYLPKKENVKCKNDTNIPEKDRTPQIPEFPVGVFHGEYCRHFKEGNRSKNVDSPFHFPSEYEMEVAKTKAKNDRSNYYNGNDWDESGKEVRGFLKQGTTESHFYSKTVKKPQRINRDCNLVSFFGTPVKYVLNKLDPRLSSRLNKKPKHQNNPSKQLKENYREDKILKTLYSKDKNEFSTSNETCTRRRRQYVSKSFSEVLDGRVGKLSCSGTCGTSDRFSPKSNSNNKCFSDTVLSSGPKYSHHQRKHRRRYEVKKPKLEQYSFETHYVHTSNMNSPHHYQREEKSPYNFSKQKSKSSKIKPAKLLGKARHSSRKKR